MGMFDDIYIDKKYLPLSKEQLESIVDDNYQTKDFDCSLDQIHVIDMRLYVKNGSSLSQMEDISVDNFYFYNGLKNRGWVEFKAYLENDVVSKIELNKFKK